MMISMALAITASVIVSLSVSWAFTRFLHSEIYSLKVDMADIQDRHLRSVRRAAANSRWSEQDELEDKLGSLLPVKQPKVKRWEKWGSRSENSSAESHPEL